MGAAEMFVFVTLGFMLLGRRLGWAMSKAILYPATMFVSVIGCLLWGIGVGLGIGCLIGWLQPGPILKWIMGFWLGAYVAIPNFGLFREATVPQRDLPRHFMIKTVPLVAYAGTELVTANKFRAVARHDVALPKVGNAIPIFLSSVEDILLIAAAALVLFLLLAWIVRQRPGWKNPIAFVVALGSSFAAGFAFDLCVRAAVGAIPSENVTIPVITWTMIGLTGYLLAWNIAESNWALFTPYLFQAGLATIGAIVGHVRNCFVALPLFGIAWLSYKRCHLVWPTYYKYDTSTSSFRSNEEHQSGSGSLDSKQETLELIQGPEENTVTMAKPERYSQAGPAVKQSQLSEPSLENDSQQPPRVDEEREIGAEVLAQSLHSNFVAERSDYEGLSNLRISDQARPLFLEKCRLYREAVVLMVLLCEANRRHEFEDVLQCYEGLIFGSEPSDSGLDKLNATKAAMRTLESLLNQKNRGQELTWSRKWLEEIGENEYNPARLVLFACFWMDEYTTAAKAVRKFSVQAQ